MSYYVEYQNIVSELGGAPRLIEWARALKPGDVIAVASTHDLKEAKYGTVAKVTPTYVWAIIQYHYPHATEETNTPAKFLIVRDGHMLISANFKESKWSEYIFPVEGKIKELVEKKEADRIRKHKVDELQAQIKHRADLEAATEIADILRRSWDFAGKRITSLSPSQLLTLSRHMLPLLPTAAKNIIDGIDEKRKEKVRDAGRDAERTVPR